MDKRMGKTNRHGSVMLLTGFGEQQKIEQSFYPSIWRLLNLFNQIFSNRHLTPCTDAKTIPRSHPAGRVIVLTE
jgi:hypothetical protein